ncbi:MAG: pantoate--beta-alanine ligase [Planctomycetota bacterium]
MEIFETKAEVYEYSLRKRGEGKSVGLVPTMGALHEGHLSLVRAAREECDTVIVSIFVNPTQFGPDEDLGKYPRAFEADCDACEALGVDAVFAPAGDEMYLPDAETYVIQERLPATLEGASRPIHFRGVLTVVLKLFNVAAPHVAYFGRKDYQQSVVVRKMAADLDVPVRIAVLPTVREADGLAMSSRNKYLDAGERRQAVCLHEALGLCRTRFDEGERSTEKLKAAMRERIDREPSARIDYVEIANPDTLEPADSPEPGDVVLIAVHVGRTRLIDNAILG